MRIASDEAPSQARSFAAAFELTGNTLAGTLTLYTPLGTTAATFSWSGQAAVMRSNGEVRHFESLNALIRQAVGTEMPVDALFAWLVGDNIAVAGWHADLSQHSQGLITARRTQPAPMAELRLVLEQ